MDYEPNAPGDEDEDDMSEHPVHTHQRDEGDEFYERVSNPDDFTDIVASEVYDAP